MRKFICLFCLPLLLLFPMETLGKGTLEKRVQDVVKKVDARYASTQDLQADFIQETKIEGFETRLSSTGQVYVKKPGMLRWDYLEPSVEQIFVKDDQLSMYVPKHNQVVKGNLTDLAASKAPLALLQGAGKLAEQFDVMPTPQEQIGAGELPLVNLIPKANERATSTIARIVLEIDPSSYLIKTINLFEITGNVSTVRFSNVRVNQGVNTSLLTLNVPDDVVIVDAPTIQ